MMMMKSVFLVEETGVPGGVPAGTDPGFLQGGGGGGVNDGCLQV